MIVLTSVVSKSSVSENFLMRKIKINEWHRGKRTSEEI